MRCCVIGFVVLAACGGGKAKVDRADAQAKVGEEAAKLVGIAVASTTCPADIAAGAGTSFACEVTFTGGGVLTFKVEQTDATGTLVVTPAGDWVLGDRMEKDLETEMFLLGHEAATVECGNAVMPVTIPAQVQCTVKNAGATATKVAVAVDKDRNVDWKLVGAP